MPRTVQVMHTPGRRLRAARLLGGYDSVESLADAIDLPNFSARTIRKIENDTRPLHQHEQHAVAALVGISDEFFTVDLARLTGPPAQQDVRVEVPPLVAQIRDGELTADQLRAAAELLSKTLLEAAEVAARGPAEGSQGQDEPDHPRP